MAPSPAAKEPHEPRRQGHPEELAIRVYPDHGHPSSLWPSRELVLIKRPDQPYILPEQMGIDDALGERILAWTDPFQRFFVQEIDDFDRRPLWLPEVDVFGWYDEGCKIVRALRVRFPGVRVQPEFAGYVFSINERRESAGLAPISLPGAPRPGHICIQDFIKDQRKQ